MKKLIILFVIILAAGIYLKLRVNEINVFVGLPDRSNENIQVFFDGELIFSGNDVENYYNYDQTLLKKSLGFYEIKASFNSREIFTEKVFVVYNQSIVIDFYSPCEEKNSCMEVRNIFRKFRPD